MGSKRSIVLVTHGNKELLADDNSADGRRAYHRAVGVGEELSELREQVLLVLEEPRHLGVDLLLRQRRRVVAARLLGVPLLLLRNAEPIEIRLEHGRFPRSIVIGRGVFDGKPSDIQTW